MAGRKNSVRRSRLLEHHFWLLATCAAGVLLLLWLVPVLWRLVRWWRARRVARAIVSIRGAPQIRALSGKEALELGEVLEFGRLHTPANVERAFQLYMQAARKGVPEGFRHAGMLAFDKLGHVRQALDLLTRAVQAGCVSATLDIGSVYATGVWPAWKADPVAARSMFELAAQHGDASTRQQALLHLAVTVGAFHTDEPSDGGRGRRIPVEYTFEVRDAVNRAFPVPVAALPQRRRGVTEPPAALPAFVQAAMDALPNIVVHGGSQNVHDTLALNAAQRGLQAIAGDTVSGDAHSDVRQHVGSHIDGCDAADGVKRDARRVLDLVDDAPHSRVGVSQLDALRRVWNRIHSPVNAPQQADMKDGLVRMLASGVENGVPVCATGRLMRIVGTLDGTDAQDIVSLKPSWAVNAELGNLSTAIRSRVLREASDADRKAYESVDNNGGAAAQRLFDSMRDALVAKTRTDYVDSGIMTQSALDIRLQPYVDALEP